MFGYRRGLGAWGGGEVSFVVKHESFDDEFAEGFSGPNSEACGLNRVNAVADGYDSVEVVKVDTPCYLARAFFLNYPEIPDS